MRQASITSYFGPGLVLYLVAGLASGRGTLDALGAAMATAAVLLSLAPLWIGPGTGVPGASRLAWLGVSAGLCLVRYVDADQMALSADLARALGTVLFGTLVLELAFSLPDRLPWPRRRWAHRWPVLLGFLMATWLVASLLPPLPLTLDSGVVLIVPPVHRYLGEVYLAGSVVAALALRLARRALGSSPEALASNAWGNLCLLPPAVLALVSGAAALFGRPWKASQLGPALAVAATLIVFGHARLIQSDRRLHAGTATRAVVALGGTVALLSLGAALLVPILPRTPVAFGFAVAASLFAGMSLHRFLTSLTEMSLAPAHGVLLRALSEPAASPVARHLSELIGQVLGVLRRGAGTPDSEPRMYFFDPPLEGRIDAAGQPHVAKRALAESVAARLRERPGELIMRGPLERQRVRQPTLRDLIDSLVHLDALCVVPLVIDGELEGAMVLPRGLRRSALTLEESEALRLFADRVAGQAAVLLSERRAQERAHTVLRDAQRAEARAEQLSDEVQRLRADAVVLRAGRAAHQLHVAPIAYSEVMRRFRARLEAVASADAPVLLEAEGGTPVQPLAYRLHESSGRSGEAFVIADCATMPRERCAEALFGTGYAAASPGFLRLADGGTLLLLDVPALPRSVQLLLAEAIATRVARPVVAELDGDATGALPTTARNGHGSRPAVGSGPYPVRARIVASARSELEALVAADRLEPELAQRLLPQRLRVPPLRERSEDLESLVLLAIDRACRLFGKPAVGLEPEARARLLDHDWPGNQGELSAVIEQAVARCQGKRIGLADLPGLGGGTAAAAPARDPLSGTFEAVERRALRRALAKASGNKSEAARALGLKRTTFLDKLRRHGLDDSNRDRTVN